jgi:MSHA biogenesis protein MshM
MQDYILHRLRKAGYAGPPIFTRGALSVLYRASDGIPRLVNILSHKTLMLAFGKGQRRINKGLALCAIRDTECVCKPRRGWRLALLGLFGLTTTCALAASYFWNLVG